jgi:hypothetical protein
MASKFRKSPPVCLVISIAGLLSGRLRLSKKYLDMTIEMEDGSGFKIFRHITLRKINSDSSMIVFVVSFKFANLSHNANRLASVLPMLIIAGFPGFIAIMYAVNTTNAYWQGMYQWKSLRHLEDYKKSFVYRTMNRRAIGNSIKSNEYINQSLTDFVENKK